MPSQHRHIGMKRPQRHADSCRGSTLRARETESRESNAPRRGAPRIVQASEWSEQLCKCTTLIGARGAAVEDRFDIETSIGR